MFTHALSTTIVMRSSSSSGATSGTDPITRPGSADVRSQVQSRAEGTTRARLTEHPRSAALLGGESDTDPAFWDRGAYRYPHGVGHCPPPR